MNAIETNARAVAAAAGPKVGIDPLTILTLLSIFGPMLLKLPCIKKFIDTQAAVKARWTNAGPVARRGLLKQLRKKLRAAEQLAAAKENREPLELTNDQCDKIITETLEHAKSDKVVGAVMACCPTEDGESDTNG